MIKLLHKYKMVTVKCVKGVPAVALSVDVVIRPGQRSPAVGRNTCLREQKAARCTWSGKGRRNVRRDSASHTKGFCLFPIQNEKPVKSFK